MELPELPKLRRRREADITPDVMRWFGANWPRSYAVEVKAKGGRVRKHQPAALKRVQSGSFDHKIPDMGQRNPFDFFGLKGADAFIVVCDGRDCVAYSHDMERRFDFRV